jgi:AcrR family transcriptional regulator
LIEPEETEATVVTPWGEASELRKRRLYPGGGTPPDEVARNQRERLFGAVVAVASEKGYEATTVSDLLILSGVSRSAFYRHFTGKADCLVAAVSQLVDPALEALEPLQETGERRDPREVFEGFLRLLCAQPAASRACFVELHAAGETGEQAADRIVEVLATAIEDVLSDDADDRDPVLIRALIGGLRKLIHTRMIRGDEDRLPVLAPDLWRWLMAVVPPPAPMEAPRRQRPRSGPAFRGYTPGERIAGAVAEVVAESGYEGTTTDAIAARASISLSTFYAHFADKQDAVLAALEMSGAQITALAVPAARRAGGWQQGVRTLYEAICAYFAAEPAMARLALVGVYGAGARACERRDHVIDSLAEMLAPGFAENPEAPAVSPEAIAATVYSLMREQLRREGPESIGAVVPLATYITLVGFVGPERAHEVAAGRPGRR